MSNHRRDRTPDQRRAQSRTTGIVPPLPPPRDGTETFPPGTFTNVYAPYYDYASRAWRWPERPAWAGLPRSERTETHR